MGQPFAKARVSSIAEQADGSKQVGIQVQVPAGVTIATAELYYSEQTPTWPDRSWVALDATPQAPDGYLATIPHVGLLAARRVRHIECPRLTRRTAARATG